MPDVFLPCLNKDDDDDPFIWELPHLGGGGGSKGPVLWEWMKCFSKKEVLCYSIHVIRCNLEQLK